MITDGKLELLFLHALPLDGTMWAAQKHILPNTTFAPTLYRLGDSVEAWAAAALKLVQGDRLIVVGCSVGGSCAIELAVAAPDRVAALVLIGTKAGHRPDPALHAFALETIREKELEEAWNVYWAPTVFTFCQQPTDAPCEGHDAAPITAGCHARRDRVPQPAQP